MLTYVSYTVPYGTCIDIRRGARTHASRETRYAAQRTRDREALHGAGEPQQVQRHTKGLRAHGARFKIVERFFLQWTLVAATTPPCGTSE